MFQRIKIPVHPKYTKLVRISVLMMIAILVGRISRVSFWFILGFTIQEDHTDFSFYINKYFKYNLLALLLAPVLQFPIYQWGDTIYWQHILTSLCVILALESMLNQRPNAYFFHALTLNIILATPLQETYGPVSYTHLTLPTKRIV